MQSALLIGNGLNRCYTNTISWGSLLQSIAEKYQVIFNEQNMFSLEFESIANQIFEKERMQQEDVYKRLKEEIAQLVECQNPNSNSIHRLFSFDIPADHILTTNYDYMLEKSFLNGEDILPKEKVANETKYSLHRYTKYPDKYFYHIHGEAEKAETLCLGYEHYAGYLAKIRKYLKDEFKANNIFSNNTKRETLSWVKLFFTHDIYIVGLSLDTSEIDLWWLLTYRASLYYSNAFEIKNRMKNNIKIFLTHEDKNQEELLRHFYIEPEVIKVGTDGYLNAYKKIASMIKDDIDKSK